MSKRQCIRNARIPHAASYQLVDILFDDKILAINPAPSELFADNNIDIKGKYLFAGGIDGHVHFMEPGFESQETFASGSAAAAAGGITCVVDMPCTSLPPVTTLANFENKLRIISNKSHVDYAFWGGVSGDAYDKQELDALKNAGVVGFKIYTISGMKSFMALTYREIAQVLAENKHYLFAFHAEDAQTITQLEIAEEIAKTPAACSLLRPVEAEVRAVQNILKVAKHNKIHFVHLSTVGALEIILQANQDVSTETCPHYLQFCSADFTQLRGRLKTAPPVKDKSQKDGLRRYLKTGKISYIASDHAGSDYNKFKQFKDFRKNYNGIPGIQHQMIYLFSEFVRTKRITPARFMELTSTNVAQRLGLIHCKGNLEVGYDADFAVIADTAPYLINEAEMLSKHKYSPFINYQFTCTVEATYLRGHLTYATRTGVSPDMTGKFTPAK